ncbi:MAG: hypothetical protein K8I27_17005 [Planctomycetes bacterium]|nr:hypothetical protein [Planctomycetota bacterium]
MKYLLLILLAGPLNACCMAPRDYAGDVDQAKQKVVVVHRAPSDGGPGYQEMLIQVQPYFKDADTNPDYLAWVITVPNTPARYDLAEETALKVGPELHERLYQLARQQWADRTQFEWPDWLPSNLEDRVAGKAGGVEEMPAVHVGPYTITPVRATGAEAVTSLNEYLDQRGLPQEDPAHLQYFIDNDFTFLCVHVTPPTGQATLGRSLHLPPLVLGFETAKPYYPGKFSSRQGNFALDLTIISDSTLQGPSYSAASRRLQAVEPGYVRLVNLYTLKGIPGDLAAALGDRVLEGAPSKWYVNRIQSPGFNATEDGKPAISIWEDDVFFTLGTVEDEIPGFWYYADDDIPFYEKWMREHAMAFMVIAGILLFSTLFIKTRINRRRLLKDKA